MQAEFTEKTVENVIQSTGLEDWLPSLTEKTNKVLKVREGLSKLSRQEPGSLLKKIHALSEFYTLRRHSVKELENFFALIEFRYKENASILDFATKAKMTIGQVTSDIDKVLVHLSEQFLNSSIKDMMDEPFGQLLEIQAKNKHIFTRDRFLWVLMDFIQSRPEAGVRESLQMVNIEHISTVADRYKTIVLKLKRNNFMYSVLRDRMSKYVRNFRAGLNMEALQAVPLQVLSHTEATAMGNYSIMSDPRQHFSEMRDHDNVNSSTNIFNNKNNMSELFQPVHRDKDDTSKEEFFPIKLSLLKAYATENEVSSFARMSNLLLYQILAKSNAAIELYTLEEVLVHGVKEFLKIMKLPASQKVLVQNIQVKKLILRRLSSLLYSIGKLVLGKLSSDNEIGMYSVVSKLFIVERKLKEVFTDHKDLRIFYNTKIDGFFAFSLKRFVNTIREKSSYFYDLYLKDNLENFKKLDLFHRGLNEMLSVDLASKLKDGSFYRIYNEEVSKNGYFKGQTAKQHYLVPFHFILHRGGPKNKGAMIWAVKAAVYELLHCLTKRRNYINFYGYFSLVLNLNAFLHDLTLQTDVSLGNQLGSIGELRFIKHFFFKLFKADFSESPKKSSSVHAVNKRLKVSYDVIDSEEGISYAEFMETRMAKMDVPSEFDAGAFYDALMFNAMVK